MLFFGHLGLTLLAIFAVDSALRKNVDYRLVLVGSLLPDLIDKPIGHYLLGSVFQNGRIFAHTLAFLALLALLALFVAGKYRYWGGIVLAAGALFHHLEDRLWTAPETWLWPLYGWEFPKLPIENYLLYLLGNFLEMPDVFVPELIGFGILAAFALRFRLYRLDCLKAFLLSGSLPVKRALKPELQVRH